MKTIKINVNEVIGIDCFKKQDFKVYGISAKVFFQGIEDTVDLLMKENHIQFSTIN